ncbi:E3 ubiquitin-protein ligase lrsam1 [Tritrichomonas musculus]|uniref:E3 ubiquitin-protein ligase lrsam1 n=1 Tax=Tritrichomonas musculus TaxID=1915356 RepID=A0ABR2KQ98_9EUKA
MGQEESLNESRIELNSSNFIFQDQNLTMIPIQLNSSNSDQIVDLNLTGNRIEALPFNLPNLRSLILTGNKLSFINNAMVNAICTYPKIEIIDLSQNDLTEIPSNILKIKSLKRVNTFGNRLSNVDCYDSHIVTLDFGQNWFEEPPKCSPYTQYLSLDMNFLKAINMSIPNLIRGSFRINQIASISLSNSFLQLQILDLSYNKLSELPDLSKFSPTLKLFDASCNKLTKFPKFPQTIMEIDLHMNQIDSLPDEFSFYPKLGSVNLSSNLLTYIPEIPQSCITLILYKNQISSFHNSTGINLRYLSIFKNNLKEIPSLRKNKIRELNLFSNCINNINISCITDKITKLNLVNNMIEKLPDELFDPQKLPNLLHLNVARNKIRELPSSFKNSMIISFNISCNPILELPSEFPSTIEQICVAHCNLSYLPEYLSKCEELVELDASGNDLSTIPYMENLMQLHLSMNKIVFFPKLSQKLVSLDLSMNFINNIPDDLKFDKLLYVDFSYNKLIDFPLSFTAPKLYSLKISHNPIISNVHLDLSKFPCLNLIDLSESKISIKKVEETHCSNTFVCENSDGSLMPSTNIRFIHCDSWCAVARKRGLRESVEDAFIIRTSFQKNLNLFGIWDARSGGKTAAIGALELEKYVNNHPFEFKEAFFSKYCNIMSKILNERSFIDGSAMGLCACSDKEMLYTNCGNMLIMIFGEIQTGNEKEIIHEDKINSQIDVSNSITVDIIENTSIIPNELHCEMVESTSSNPFSASLGLEIATHFVCGIKEFKPTDKWVVIASPGITNFLSPKEIGQISKTTDTSFELAYKLVTIARASDSTESLSVIIYNIKEANSA